MTICRASIDPGLSYRGEMLQIPALLGHHEVFLEELRRRLDTWELRQTIGDVFLDVVSLRSWC